MWLECGSSRRQDYFVKMKSGFEEFIKEDKFLNFGSERRNNGIMVKIEEIVVD